MLEIKDVSIKFGNKIILENKYFKANSNKLTIIKGKSGIGKSSFLNAFLFKYNCKYLYNNKNLMELSEDEKEQFIYEKLSFVHAIPLFIDAMNIEEHIKIIESMDKKRLSNIEQSLGITDLLTKYPKELSGGEKSRVAFYLGLIKEPEIFILDEPTSSLDINYADIMIDLIMQYAHNGHIVIVSTHDNHLIDKADLLYEIYDYKLNIIKDTSKDLTNNTFILSNNDKPKIKLKFTHKIFKLVMTILVSLTLLTNIFSFNIYNNYNQSYQNILNSASSLDIIVYKSKYDNDYFTFAGNEYPFTDNELKKLKKIDNIKNISNHYDINYNEYDLESYFDELVDKKEKDSNLLSLSLYDNDKLLNKNTIEDFSMHSYDENNDYSSLLEYNFHKNGIILSHNMFTMLYDDDIDKDDLYIEYILLIPKYNSTNISEMLLDDSSVKINHVNCVMKKVKLPIAGILKEDSYIYNIEGSKNYIYIPNNLLNQYINKYKANKARKIYSIIKNDDYIKYYDKIPDNIGNYELDQEVTQTPWSPNSYVITVDNIENVNKVEDEVNNLGFKTISNFVDSDTFNILNKNNKYILMLFMCTIIIVIYIFYIYLKYLLLEEESIIKDYFTNIGYTIKEINSFFINYYIKKAIVLFILTSILFYLTIQLAVKMQIISLIIKPKIIYFIYFFIISFVIELVIPLILKKYTQ